MYLKSILFVLAILSGSQAKDDELPKIGDCTYMEYHCDANKCQTDFFKGLQKDPNGDCSAKFKKLINCVIKTVEICVGNVLPESWIVNLVHGNFKENTTCLKGGREIPSLLSLDYLCNSSFIPAANNCSRNFHQKFDADKSDPELCSENADAKKCLKNVTETACTFDPKTKPALDLQLGFSDYNPFCDNNRDPGATGKDQCDEVKDLNNPLNNSPETAGMRIGVLQALLIPFLLLFFFV